MEKVERYRGCLIGLAVGDALGTTLEFTVPGSFEPIDDMVGGGPFKLRPGEWTDDTSMALCLAASLIEKKEFDPHDQLGKYVDWYRNGYMSHNGYCFDIGNTIASALARFESTGAPFCGSTHERSAGNGSIMRLAPVPMAYRRKPESAIHRSAESSKTTHACIECVDACRYFGGLIVGALNGASKDELLSPHFSPVHNYWEISPLTSTIDEIAMGSYKMRNPPEIEGSGYVVKSLEAALWAFYRTDSFQDGALASVNLGKDADTTGAVYGQIAGAYYGISGIPERWIEKLAMQTTIYTFADRLYELSEIISL